MGSASEAGSSGGGLCTAAATTTKVLRENLRSVYYHEIRIFLETKLLVEWNIGLLLDGNGIVFTVFNTAV